MKTELKLRYQQTGAYLLEALVGILIFALGVLGIVGLQAAALRTTSDSSVRAEAVFAASQLVGQMWADKYVNLATNYSSTTAGATYVSWAADLKAAQGGAWVVDPIVDPTNALGNCNAAPNAFSQTVYIQIFWQSPDGQANASCGGVPCHWYSTCGLVAMNFNQ
jgi:type IV pilus assembly protein PilV